ncbi:hypothetical protein, partial [Paracidovorax avenae]|uniref:hypothetical protein n=1 Tax=Paracidovorax avenae TaxID=80867 RepID=UPI000D205B06
SGHLHQINLGLAEEWAQEASPQAPQGSLSGETLQASGLGGGPDSVLPEPVREVHRLIADIERDALHREVLRTQGTLST